LVKLRDIWQSLYPYGLFRTGEAVYLTFDDGPIPEVTPRVLDILDRYGVKATFFMVGENIYKHPDVFDKVVQAGHTIGNHTYNHLKGWRCTTAEYLANVEQFPKETNLFRPPYGKATFWQRRALVKQGYTLIYWDVLTRDYEATRTPEAMLAQVKQQVRAGSIINFHDSLKSNERMLAVLPQVIEFLQTEGYRMESLRELMN